MVAERLAAGELDHRVAIDSGDEFDELATAFNAMSRQIEQSQAVLVQTARMSTMGQMAAGIIHEIRQPLSLALKAAVLQYFAASNVWNEVRLLISSMSANEFVWKVPRYPFSL